MNTIKPEWAPIIDENIRGISRYRHSETNIADVTLISLSQHGDKDAPWGSFVKPIRLHDNFLAKYSSDIQEAKDAALALAWKMLDEAEKALNMSVSENWNRPLWDDFDLNRYGVVTRYAPDFFRLCVERGPFGFTPVVFTVYGEHRYSAKRDIEEAKAIAEGLTRKFIASAREGIQFLTTQNEGEV